MKRNGKTKRPPRQRVRLEFRHETAKEVLVAGTFNDWKPAVSPMISLGNGNWAGEIMLPAGRYEYLLVVDGQWVLDPNANDDAPNPYGGVNSVLVVSP